ncbi:MAG: hypothetical protein AABY22_07895, partial [Nanoarchaeota archaeon]
ARMDKQFDKGIIKSLEDLKRRVSDDRTYNKEKYKQEVISLIQKNPIILGHDCKIKLIERVMQEDAEKEFKQALSNWIIRYLDSDSKLELIRFKTEPKLNFSLKSIGDIKKPDLIFLLKLESEYKLLSIELKFGKGDDFIDQCIKTHLIIKKLFKDIEVKTIVFSPYNHFDNIKEEIIKELSQNKHKSHDIPYLLLESIHCCDNIKTCFGKFNKKEEEFIKMLRVADYTKSTLYDHLDSLRSLIKEII